MTKKEMLLNEYRELIGTTLNSLLLEIHMPTGEIETIVNPNIVAKTTYINSAYDDNLRLKTCDDIYITSWIFIPEAEELKNLSFSEAFEYIKENGGGIRLPSWSKDVIIKIQWPDKNSKMTAPYLYVESRFGRVPWKETNIELFSNNWEVVR